jgi:uncharacterized protein YdeI (YjbR/CyaY-like superfamily)
VRSEEKRLESGRQGLRKVVLRKRGSRKEAKTRRKRVESGMQEMKRGAVA